VTDDGVYLDTPETAPDARTPAQLASAEIRRIRSSHQYQDAVARFRLECATHYNEDGTIGARCWLDGDPIDYRLRYPHPLSFSMDHAIPVRERPDLMLDPENFRPSHLDCNVRRGTDDPALDIGEASEIW
jgi:hypothetical protein